MHHLITIKTYYITPWFNHICHTYKKNTNILNKIYNKNKNTIMITSYWLDLNTVKK